MKEETFTINNESGLDKDRVRRKNEVPKRYNYELRVIFKYKIIYDLRNLPLLFVISLQPFYFTNLSTFNYRINFRA